MSYQTILDENRKRLISMIQQIPVRIREGWT